MKKKILVIEDSVDFRTIFMEYLSRDFDVVDSLDEKEIESLIPTVDLVICDYHFSPVLTFERVVEIVAERVPVILCSGSPDVTYKNAVPKCEISQRLKDTVQKLVGERVGA